MRTRLAEPLQLLTGGARDLQQPQTLRGAIDWSYDLLTLPSKGFSDGFRFRGRGHSGAVEAVCNTKNDLGFDLLDGMASIVDKSLVQQVDQPSGDLRFVMLENDSRICLGQIDGKRGRGPDERAHAAILLV